MSPTPIPGEAYTSASPDDMTTALRERNAASSDVLVVDAKARGLALDGVTNDGPALNALIAALSAAGGARLYVLGRCHSQEQIIVRSNVELFGSQWLTVFTGALPTFDALFRTPLTGASENISLHDFTIDRTGTNIQHAIRLRGVTGLDIHRVRTFGSNTGLGQGGSFIIGGFATPDLSDVCYDVNVSDCRFKAADNFCVQFGGVIRGVIKGNIAEDCYREVYGVEPGTGLTASDITIAGNIAVTGTTKNSTSTSTGVIVVTESSGGTVRDVTVSANNVSASTPIAGDPLAGIIVVGGQAVNITGNTVRSMNGPGIAIGTASTINTVGTSVVGNKVFDCNQGGHTSVNDVGIRLRNAYEIQVGLNTVKGPKHRLPVEETSITGTAGSVIAGNIFIGNASTSLPTLAGGTIWASNKMTRDAGDVAVINQLSFADGRNLAFGSAAGTKIGTTTTGKLSFYGAAPVARPALTYSRTGETAAEAALRTALATLGLVTDSTTA